LNTKGHHADKVIPTYLPQFTVIQ